MGHYSITFYLHTKVQLAYKVKGIPSFNIMKNKYLQQVYYIQKITTGLGQVAYRNLNNDILSYK